MVTSAGPLTERRGWTISEDEGEEVPWKPKGSMRSEMVLGSKEGNPERGERKKSLCGLAFSPGKKVGEGGRGGVRINWAMTEDREVQALQRTDHGGKGNGCSKVIATCVWRGKEKSSQRVPLPV